MARERLGPSRTRSLRHDVSIDVAGVEAGTVQVVSTRERGHAKRCEQRTGSFLPDRVQLLTPGSRPRKATLVFGPRLAGVRNSSSFSGSARLATAAGCRSARPRHVHGFSRLSPRAESASQRCHVGEAHLLQCSGGEKRSRSASAIAHDRAG